MPDTEFAISADAGAERYDRWREALADAFGPFEVHHGKPAQFAGHVRYARRASLQFNDLHYQGQQLERTAGNVSRLDQEFYTFGLPLSGPLAVVQQGREFQVEPGCVYLMNQSLPYQATALGAAGYQPERVVSAQRCRSAIPASARSTSCASMTVRREAPCWPATWTICSRAWTAGRTAKSRNWASG